MNNTDMIRLLREWAQGKQSPAPIYTEFLDGFAEGYRSAQEYVLEILEAQPDPHPLASVRFGSSLDQFKKYWEAQGFEVVGGWARRFVSDGENGLVVYHDGDLYVHYRVRDLEDGQSLCPFIPRPSTYGDALNELTSTKIMGGWA